MFYACRFQCAQNTHTKNGGKHSMYIDISACGTAHYEKGFWKENHRRSEYGLLFALIGPSPKHTRINGECAGHDSMGHYPWWNSGCVFTLAATTSSPTVLDRNLDKF